MTTTHRRRRRRRGEPRARAEAPAPDAPAQPGVSAGDGGVDTGDSGIALRFARMCATVAAVLPFGLSRVVDPTFIGFALINGFTFSVDLLLLTAMHGWLGWPIEVSIALGYAAAFGLGFVLNRTLNFRSHAPAGRQVLLYVVVVAINFGVILLGVGAGLAAVGVEYHLARVAAGVCEGVFMYCAMRWVVFGRRGDTPA
ncbi:GtrA family protein [Pseudonocardia alaniniphila]|uniref:GtrA family protein n=1 Tax=Pseudonocardia alaniniphila TaxID=75291 RepID=A0ABS9TU99_9PSEU|nr:GtrA family protein [Pseudonocardia alaniniphila]MCH6172142.1 GtrA family protein [Pseudonocardia alaniniphila]